MENFLGVCTTPVCLTPSDNLNLTVAIDNPTDIVVCMAMVEEVGCMHTHDPQKDTFTFHTTTPELYTSVQRLVVMYDLVVCCAPSAPAVAT